MPAPMALVMPGTTSNGTPVRERSASSRRTEHVGVAPLSRTMMRW
jgi:hypothetical protein